MVQVNNSHQLVDLKLLGLVNKIFLSKRRIEKKPLYLLGNPHSCSIEYLPKSSCLEEQNINQNPQTTIQIYLTTK